MRKILMATVATAMIFSSCDVFSGSKTTANVPKKTPTKETPKVEEPAEEKVETRVTFAPNDDLSAAIDKAKATKKPIFLDFYTTWCMPCRMMDESVFRDWDIADYMNENVVSLKINCERGNGITLSKQFGVMAYPTMVFIDPKGIEIVRHEGSLSMADFKLMMKKAVWKTRNPE